MQWNTEDIYNHIKVYNREFFENKITWPIVIKWSKQLLNSGSRISALTSRSKDRDGDNYHIIKLNARLATATREAMRNILAHEMIHCLQDEIDPTWEKTYKKDEGHNDFFYRWCNKLNKEHHFRFPLERYVSDKVTKSQNKNATGVYYVYQWINWDDGTHDGVGVFIKFLYKEEIDTLMSHGLRVKYYPTVTFNSSCSRVELKNTKLTAKRGKSEHNTEDNNTTTYYKIKNIVVGPGHVQFDQQLKYHEITRNYFWSYEFDFNSGLDVLTHGITTAEEAKKSLQ